MAIPISRYIGINSKVVPATDGDFDQSGLMFTSETIQTGSSKKADYEAGKVISITPAELTDTFASNTNIYKAALKYFGWTNVNGAAPSKLYVAKRLTSSETTFAASFTRVLNSFTNFFTFGFVDATSSDTSKLLEVAQLNAALGRTYLMCVGTTKSSVSSVSSALKGISGVIMTFGTDMTDVYLPMAYAATLDYGTNSTGRPSLMYREVPEALALVDNTTDADNYETMRVNYGAKVQTRAVTRCIYQPGVNADGEDTSVYLDSIWLTSKIEEGWMTLAVDNGNVPSDGDGLAKIQAMLNGVINNALDNGVILTNKTLSESAKQEVISLTGEEEAVERVQEYGYVLRLNLTAETVNENETHVCNYLLIYGKGDSVKKINGQHVLV